MAYNMYNPQGYFNQPQQMVPSGQVFMVNNSYEAANIPMGIGTTVAISLNDNIMYLKNAANGAQNVIAYKLTPYTEPQRQLLAATGNNDLEKRMAAMEQQISMLVNSLNNNNKKKETKDREPIPWDT